MEQGLMGLSRKCVVAQGTDGVSVQRMLKAVNLGLDMCDAFRHSARPEGRVSLPKVTHSR